MKKITIYTLLLLFIFAPHITFAKSLKVLSPTKADEYRFGETINIEWSSEKTGVTTILLKPSKKNGYSTQLYGMKGYGDPTNYSGYFDYKLPDYLVIPAGEYIIELTLANGKKVKSKKFNITNQNSLNIESGKANYSLGKPEGLQKTYKRGEMITFAIDGFEQPKIKATAQNSFHIQSLMYVKNKKDKALEVVNSRYDYQLQKWVIEMTAPDKRGSYEVEVVFYCANISLTSYCANKYPNSDQISKRFGFKVK